MACLVVSGELLFLVAHLVRLLLRTYDNLNGRFLDFSHCDCLLVSPCGKQCSFVKKIFEVCADKADGRIGNNSEVNVGCERFILGMNPENSLSALGVGIADSNLAVKTAGSQQSRVKDIGTVCRRNDDNSLIFLKAVHLNKELIESLLSLVMSAAHSCASVASDGVDFINEDNRRSVFLRLVKKVSDSRSADTDIHFNEIGTGNREERNICFTGNGSRKEGLTCTRRAYKKHALGDSCAEGAKLFGALEEVNHFAELFLFLICACDLFKGRL